MSSKKPSNKKEEENLQGISGWLILPFIHMFIYIGMVLYDLLVNVPQVSTNYIAIGIVIDIILLALFIITLIFGFMKKRTAKTFFIISYSANIILTLIIASIMGSYDNVAQVLIAGALWIWYFSVSVRVENTFIE